MTRVRGAITGIVVAPLAVTGGAVLGFINGWAPCQGVPYSATGAMWGAVFYAAILGLPAGVLGTAIGAAFAQGPRGWSIGQLMFVIAAVALTLALTVGIGVQR